MLSFLHAVRNDAQQTLVSTKRTLAVSSVRLVRHVHTMLRTMLHNNGTNIYYITHTNVWESMGKPCSCMQFIKSRIFYCKSCENPYQYYMSRENPYQVLQVMHAASECAMKSKVCMIKSLSP